MTIKCAGTTDMTDFLKARFYVYLHSKLFISVTFTLVIWCLIVLLRMLGLGSFEYPISSVYGYGCFLALYITLVPVFVPFWYGGMRDNRFGDNIPFRSDNRFSLSAIIFAMIMNAISVLFMIICGLVLFNMKNPGIVYYNDPLTMLKITLLTVATSFVYSAISVVLVEITGSKIWGMIFGLLIGGGVSSEIIWGFEGVILKLRGIDTSTFPVARSTVYSMFFLSLPKYIHPEQWVVTELPSDISVRLVKLTVYFVVFLIAALILSRRERA